MFVLVFFLNSGWITPAQPLAQFTKSNNMDEWNIFCLLEFKKFSVYDTKNGFREKCTNALIYIAGKYRAPSPCNF